MLPTPWSHHYNPEALRKLIDKVSSSSSKVSSKRPDKNNREEPLEILWNFSNSLEQSNFARSGSYKWTCKSVGS